MKEKEVNQWKTATIFLSIFCVFLVLSNLYEVKKDMENEKKRICNMIEGFPSWVDPNGGLIGMGLISIKEANKNFYDNFTNTLIRERIQFIYNPSCSACKNQIELFGEENWKRYESKGLAINCEEVLK